MAEEKDEKPTADKTDGGSDSGSADTVQNDEAQWKQLEETIERVTGKVVDERLGKWQPPTPAAHQSGRQEGQKAGAETQESQEKGRSKTQRKQHWLEKWMNWPGPTNA